MDFKQIVQKNIDVLIKLLPIISFAIPFIVLYCLYPRSFEETWKGRTFYIFFIWLFVLEIILNWDKYISKTAGKPYSTRRLFAIGIALVLPTVYVIIANFYGLNAQIMELASQYNMDLVRRYSIDPSLAPPVHWMTLSSEYLVFTASFTLVILFAYGFSGLKKFSLSTSLLGVIGTLYLIDNLLPYGFFTPFQIFVQPTAMLAANVLNLMGYRTSFSGYLLGTPQLTVYTPTIPPRVSVFGIGWPCSGVESLIIYTVTILLFLKKSDIPWKHRIIYFAIGAMITYLINILRIVTIFVIDLNGGDWERFHNYYGSLYSIIWIVSYPLIIIGSRILWRKVKNWKSTQTA